MKIANDKYTLSVYVSFGYNCNDFSGYSKLHKALSYVYMKGCFIKFNVKKTNPTKDELHSNVVSS